MLAALLPLALLHQSKLDTPITYQGPTASLPAVMKQIGDQAEVRISVLGAPARDYIYLQVKDRPLSKVLDLVAQATQSRWTEVEPNHFKIHAPWNPDAPDPADVEAIRRLLAAHPIPPQFTRQEAEEIVREGIEAFALPSGSARYEKMGRLIDRTPSIRALIEFLHALGPEAIAAAPSGERQTYLLHPTGSAQSHPPAARAALHRLPQNLLLLQEAMNRRGVDAEPPPRHSTNLWSDADFAGQPAADWRIAILRSGDFLTTTLTRVDQDGSYSLPERMLPLVLYHPEPRRNPFSETEAPFDWPAEILPVLRPAREILRYERPLPEPILERYARCSQEETLTTGFESPLAAYAAAHQSDLVAVLPDTALDALITCPAETNLARDALFRLFPNPVIEQSSGVISIRPARLHQSRRDRLPRIEAAAVFRSAVQAGVPSLDSLADLCFKTESREAFQRAEETTQWFNSQPTRTSVDPFALGLYAGLGPSLRESALGAHLIIPAKSLPPSARTRLNRFVRGTFADVSPDPKRTHRTSVGTASLSADPIAMIGESVILRSDLHFNVSERWFVATLNPDNPSDSPKISTPDSFVKTPQDRLDLPIYAAYPEVNLTVQLQLPDKRFLTGIVRLYRKPRYLRGTPFKDLPTEIHRLLSEAKRSG